MQKRISALVALLIALLMGFVGSTPAFATPPDSGDDVIEQVCPTPAGSLKEDNPPAGSKTLVVSAPEGYVIVGACVKAGSAKHGDGPEALVYDGVTSVTLSHTSGKDISHYVLLLQPIIMAPPTVEVIKIQPLAPHPMDYCGVEFDDIEIPKDEYHKLPISYVRVDHDTVIAVPNKGFSFHEDLVVKWDFTFSSTPCPTPITVQPDAPVFGDQCGTVNDTMSWKKDTVGYSYVREGDVIVAKPWEEYFFVQGITKTSWKIELTDVPCEDVVVPPVTDVPPVNHDTPVTSTPVDVVIPNVPIAPAVSATETVSTASAADTVTEATIPAGNLADTGASLNALMFAVFALIGGTVVLSTRRFLPVKK